MATITPANLSYKDKDGDLGEVKSLTDTDVTLLNNALQDIEDLKLAYMPGYVKRDFSNVTQDGKNAAVGWGMPNWNASISLTKNTSYTASEAGFLYIYTRGYNGDTATITINSFSHDLFFHGSSGQTEGTTFIFPIAKGDSYKITHAYSQTLDIYFIPCKGAN